MTRKQRVLIAEDDASTLDALTSILAAHGHDCTRASSAGEAYRHCQREKFDCMVLDAQFDHTPGLALAERLSHSARRPTRILVVTGHPREDFEAALRNGLIDGYLQKPVDPQRIHEFVAKD